VICLTPDIFDLPVVGTMAVFTGSFLFALWVWRQHQFAGKRAFLAAEAGMLWWLFAAGMEMSNQTLGCKLFWAQAAWPGIILMPSAWTMFLFHYALGHDASLPQLKRFSLWIAPPIISLVAFSNGYHHLMYTEATRLTQVDGRLSAQFDHGPFFYLAVGYVYAFMLASIGIGVASLRRANSQLRPFFVTLLLITLVPITGNLAYVLGDVTVFGFDPTPFMFAFVVAAFGWLIVNNRMMDITAIARDILFNDTRSPIIIFDDEGLLSGANLQAQEMLGMEKLAIGTALRTHPTIGPLVARAVTGGSLPPQSAMTWENRSFDPRLTALPSPINPKGPAVGWTIAFIDVTEQQMQADMLAQAAQQAQAASQAKSDFLSTVSHELRTPLTSIQGALDIVRMTAKDELPEQSAQLIEIAASNTRRLKALIDDLLDLQRMEQGLMEFKMERLDLRPMIKEAIEANKSYLDSYGVAATVDLPATPCYIEGDQKRLSQVMANLLSNAAKFSDHGKTVDVALRQKGRQVSITVRDHGVGIPPGSEEKVFGRFSQVDSAATRSRGGSGLGLNITQEILEAHDGSVRYESTLGHGTTFIVTLPLAA
jgi:signal transduction histidine kinase